MRVINSSTVFVVIGLALGFGSALQSLDSWGTRPVVDNEGWREWQLALNDRMQPYAIGHFLAAGSVPAPSSTHYYLRNVDDDGFALRGDCNFIIDGPAISARWWSLSIQGTAAQNSHSVISAGRAVLDNNLQLHATIALRPQPGNWLQPPDTGPFTLTYVVSQADKDAVLNLPRIKKGSC